MGKWDGLGRGLRLGGIRAVGGVWLQFNLDFLFADYQCNFGGSGIGKAGAALHDPCRERYLPGRS
jgi:hypothetical protein